MASAQKKRRSHEKPGGSSGADIAEIARLKSQLASALAEGAKLQATAEGLQERTANLQTANNVLQTDLTKLNNDKNQLFQFLCKEETKTGRLEGELTVLRMMFYKNNSKGRADDPSLARSHSDPLNSSRDSLDEEDPINCSQVQSRGPTFSSQFLQQSGART